MLFNRLFSYAESPSISTQKLIKIPICYVFSTSFISLYKCKTFTNAIYLFIFILFFLDHYSLSTIFWFSNNVLEVVFIRHLFYLSTINY